MKKSTEMALTLKLKMMFPDLPDDVLMKVVPDLSSLKGNEGHRIPWNRHGIVIHLFSGPDYRFWEKKLAGSGAEVLCVDLSGYVPADLHDHSLPLPALPGCIGPNQSIASWSTLPHCFGPEVSR